LFDDVLNGLSNYIATIVENKRD